MALEAAGGRALGAHDLATRLGVWAAGGGPLYERLAAALERAVRGGDLPIHSRLPAERTLADALAVSRTTVAAAYARLRDAGLVDRRQGAGTFVRYAPERRASRGTALSRDLSGNPVLSGLVDEVAMIDLRGAYMVGTDDLPADGFAAAADALTGLRHEHGYLPAGLPALREVVAGHLTATGLPTVPGQVLITSGAQQALALTASLVVGPGEPVVSEALTAPGSIGVFATVGAQVVTVPVGAEGVDVGALAAVVRRTRPRLVYLVASVHNPLGVSLPPSQRRAVARLVAEAPDTLFVEDDTLRELWLTSPPPAPIAALDGAEGMLTIGSCSKVFWGGLRVGWVRGPEAEIRRLARLKAVNDVGSSLPAQAIAVQLLRRLDALGPVRRETVRQRRDALAGALTAELPRWRWQLPAGGLCLWVQLPEGSAAALAQVAARHGVAIAPGGVVSPEGGWDDHLRLPYGQPAAVLCEAVRRLAAAWQEYGEVAGDAAATGWQVVV